MFRLFVLQIVFQVSNLVGVICAPTSVGSDATTIQNELNKLNTVPVVKLNT